MRGKSKPLPDTIRDKIIGKNLAVNKTQRMRVKKSSKLRKDGGRGMLKIEYGGRLCEIKAVGHEDWVVSSYKDKKRSTMQITAIGKFKKGDEYNTLYKVGEDTYYLDTKKNDGILRKYRPETKSEILGKYKSEKS